LIISASIQPVHKLTLHSVVLIFIVFLFCCVKAVYSVIYKILVSAYKNRIRPEGKYRSFLWRAQACPERHPSTVLVNLIYSKHKISLALNLPWKNAQNSLEKYQKCKLSPKSASKSQIPVEIIRICRTIVDTKKCCLEIESSQVTNLPVFLFVCFLGSNMGENETTTYKTPYTDPTNGFAVVNTNGVWNFVFLLASLSFS
jgi:hypothetical protein